MSWFVIPCLLAFSHGAPALPRLDPAVHARYAAISMLPEAGVCPMIATVRVVSLVQGEELADAERKRVRIDQPVTLYAVVEARDGDQDQVYSDAPLKMGRGVLSSSLWPAACPLAFTWYKVEAEAESYSNPGSEPTATISYAQTQWAQGWSVVADVHPTLMHDDFQDVQLGQGVMRYMVTARTEDAEVQSPGKECRESGAICRAVHAVSYRPDDSYIGYLHELFNTPYIYGSKRIKGGHQSDLLVGSDCADFAVYGKRRQIGKSGYDYTYTGGLRKLAGKRWSVDLDSEGYYQTNNKERLTFGPEGEIRPGNLINFEEGHVGVLYQDDGDGLLDTGDLIMHTLFREPEIVSIAHCRWGGIHGKEVLRFKK